MGKLPGRYHGGDAKSYTEDYVSARPPNFYGKFVRTVKPDPSDALVLPPCVMPKIRTLGQTTSSRRSLSSRPGSSTA